MRSLGKICVGLGIYLLIDDWRCREACRRAAGALVTRDCARCHAVGRTGASTHPQAPPFRTLAKRYPIDSLEEALGEGIISGHPAMPEFRFASADVGAIIAYLK